MKDVTGFSGFELTLASSKERELVVEEEASYETEVASPAEIESFLRHSAPALVDSGAMDAGLCNELTRLVFRANLAAAASQRS